jgi:beta-glucosidase
VVLAGEEAILAVGKPGEKAAQFYLEDWGGGSLTLLSVDKGLYLDIPAKPQGNPMDPDAPPPVIPDPWIDSIRAIAKTTFNWNVTTLYSLVPQEGDLVLWKTWDNRRLVAGDGNIELLANPAAAPGEYFKVTVERRGFDAVAAAAKAADTAIVFIGNDPLINSREEVDRSTLDLPPRQEALATLVAELNPRTILALISSYPYTCGKLLEKIPGALWAAHGMQEFGRGFTDVLSGAVSPAGRLTMTWYEDLSQLPSMMEYDIIKARTTYQYFPGPVLFPFGHGLSYSSFEYSGLKIEKPIAKAGETVTISFTVKNTGKVQAEEVPQLYLAVSGSRVRRPIATLKGFDRLSFAPGESKTVSFTVQVKDLAVWDVTRDRFVVESGSCGVFAGASSRDIRLSGKFEIQGEIIPPRNALKDLYVHNFDDYAEVYLHEKRGSTIPAVFSRGNGAWTKYEGVDFGVQAGSFKALVSGKVEGAIEIRLDSPEGRLAGVIKVPNTEEVYPQRLLKYNFRPTPSWALATGNLEGISGIHDLFFVFRGEAALWKFSAAE